MKEFLLLVLVVAMALTSVVSASPSPQFIAVSYSTDGSSQVAGTIEFSSIFGDSSTRNTEAEVFVSATFSHSITNFTVLAGVANCGTLAAGESIVVTLRVNGVNSQLSGVCSNGSAANSKTVDSDVVNVVSGDRLSIGFNLSGTILTRTINLGVSAEGLATGFDDKNGDPLKVFVSPVIANPGETVLVDISESFSNGTVRTGNSNGTFIDVYNGTGVLIVSDAHPTEIGLGSYRYSFQINDTTIGNWIVLVNTTDPTSGNPVGSSNTFFLEPDGNVEPVSDFETATSTSGIEFLALFALVVIAVILWSRSLDLVVKVLAGVLCFVAAIAWMLLISAGGSPANQTFKVACAVVSGVIGGYLIIRTFYDVFQGRKGVA